jgi:hypothetical protein
MYTGPDYSIAKGFGVGAKTVITSLPSSLRFRIDRFRSEGSQLRVRHQGLLVQGVGCRV